MKEVSAIVLALMILDPHYKHAGHENEWYEMRRKQRS
jgi:hypothetical protein